MSLRGLFCGTALLALAGCSAGQDIGRDLLNSVPLIGTKAPAAPKTIELEGAVLTLPLAPWVEIDRKQSSEGSLISYRPVDGPVDGNAESLEIQALRAHAATPVDAFAGGLQNNIRSVCKTAAIAPLTRHQVGPSTALILRFSCETKAGARTTGGLQPYEAGLYAIVPTKRAMLVIQRAWSGTDAPEDFSTLTLRPDWTSFLEKLSVCDPGNGAICS